MVEPAQRWLLALCLLGSLSAQAASPVWAIRGPHNTVYLAGSIHLLRAGDAALPAAMSRAYADSARLVMEIDLARHEPLELAQSMLRHGLLPAATSLADVVGAARYQRVTTAAATLGLPAAALDRETPWMVGLQLTELEYLHLGFDPEQGVELQLVRRALADHKPTGGLESIDDELAVFEALLPQEQLRFLDMAIADLGDADSDTSEVLDAWRHGDTQRLGALLAREYRSFPTLYRALVSERNRRWLPQIEQLLKQREDCLVVVGALHLIGDGGLLELLRHDGIAAEQLN
ncbi:MAG TPA: TraB/GumN family protein [Steroidobacteraceae bacterium]|nr:TraB/GumN family protein [Steroidobacteraceae bacterium]